MTDDTIAISRQSLQRTLLGVAIGAVILVLLFVAWQQRDRLGSVLAPGAGASIDRSTYQAVFLAGGQVYFGRLSTAGDDYLLLDDVFYLPQQEPQADANVGQLIKRGNELHGPSEPMIIPVLQVLFIENLSWPDLGMEPRWKFELAPAGSRSSSNYAHPDQRVKPIL